MAMRFERRSFLALMSASVLALRETALGEDNPLHVLSADNVERLRLDFNASRNKVRLLFLLSPT